MAGLAGRVLAGALAGAAGTLAMDLVWYRRYRSDGGDESFAAWELSTSAEDFEDAGAPAQVARKVADAAGVDLPDTSAGAANNVVHWLTGIGYGVGHGLAHHRRGLVTGGLLTATGAFANSYATLGAIGVYEPVWEYDRETLVKDWTAHLAYGLVTAAVYRLLRR